MTLILRFENTMIEEVKLDERPVTFITQRAFDRKIAYQIDPLLRASVQVVNVIEEDFKMRPLF